MARDAGWAVQWSQHRCPCTDACDGFPPVGGGARSQPYYVFVYQLLAGVAHVILPTNPSTIAWWWCGGAPTGLLEALEINCELEFTVTVFSEAVAYA